MKKNNEVYNSYQSKKQMGSISLIISFGLILSLGLGYLYDNPKWVQIGIIVVTTIVMVIFLNFYFPVKVSNRFIYLPYGYREKKDKRKIALSEIWWIKKVQRSQGRKGLKFRDKNEEYFIPNILGYSDEVFEALEKAMGDKFYEVYRGEE